MPYILYIYEYIIVHLHRNVLLRMFILGVLCYYWMQEVADKFSVGTLLQIRVFKLTAYPCPPAARLIKSYFCSAGSPLWDRLCTAWSYLISSSCCWVLSSGSFSASELGTKIELISSFYS